MHRVNVSTYFTNQEKMKLELHIDLINEEIQIVLLQNTKKKTTKWSHNVYQNEFPEFIKR